mmetsp:Transcript_20080/g.47136  ORF Transcript_20080/g.47136 Transcript_20080/m.47136 type:complete len:428 (-) Transcript_20080:3734-5017(-)
MGVEREATPCLTTGARFISLSSRSCWSVSLRVASSAWKGSVATEGCASSRQLSRSICSALSMATSSSPFKRRSSSERRRAHSCANRSKFGSIFFSEPTVLSSGPRSGTDAISSGCASSSADCGTNARRMRSESCPAFGSSARPAFIPAVAACCLCAAATCLKRSLKFLARAVAARPRGVPSASICELSGLEARRALSVSDALLALATAPLLLAVAEATMLAARPEWLLSGGRGALAAVAPAALMSGWRLKGGGRACPSPSACVRGGTRWAKGSLVRGGREGEGEGRGDGAREEAREGEGEEGGCVFSWVGGPNEEVRCLDVILPVVMEPAILRSAAVKADDSSFKAPSVAASSLPPIVPSSLMSTICEKRVEELRDIVTARGCPEDALGRVSFPCVRMSVSPSSPPLCVRHLPWLQCCTLSSSALSA